MFELYLPKHNCMFVCISFQAYFCLFSLQVESEDSYERIGGTATGGGTFWGLGSLLTKAKV
jgi:pantothenate kinase